MTTMTAKAELDTTMVEQVRPETTSADGTKDAHGGAEDDQGEAG